MFFKFIEKPIVLDCFTNQPYVINYAPVHYAIKHIPKWWKNLPITEVDDMRINMRNCVGMIDYYRKSVTIPLWSDLRIYVHNNGMFEWQFSDGATVGQPHDKVQMTGFLENSHGHLKIKSPWKFKCNKNIHWVWSHPTYNYAHSYDVVSLPGIAEYYYQHSTNINLMLDVRQEKKIFIPQGQPMAVLTPMSNKKVKIVRHLVSTDEMAKMNTVGASITFKAKYKQTVKRKEQFKDCPYHEGI